MDYAPNLFRALRGIFCIYKPQGQTMKATVRSLQVKLAADLNSMVTRPVRERVILHEENVGTDLPVVTTVPDLADHPLVLGPRYQCDDFEINYLCRLEATSSGIVVMGIGPVQSWLRGLAQARYIRTHHVKGELGKATQDFTAGGRLIEKSTYHHVTHAKIDRIIAGIQAAQQRYMFDAAGINRQTQEAYDLAAKGLIRPTDEEAGAVIYNIKCIQFEPPHFTLEVHSINEDCAYLRNLVHDLGLELRTSAVCTQVRRVRYGHFTLGHALLHKHWTGQSIAENIDFCRPLLKELNEEKTQRAIQQSVHQTDQQLEIPELPG